MVINAESFSLYNLIMIKVITFDLDGVYFLNGKKNFIKALVARGVSEKEAIRVFLKSDEMNKFYKTGEMSGGKYWNWALKKWGLENMSVSEIVGLLISGYEINQEAQRLARDLWQKGYKTAICSNNFVERIQGLEKRFDFLSDFDVRVFSYEVGALKPDLKIFQELVNRSECKPEEIVYSDDDETRFTGATRLGIKTFLYENFPQFKQELAKLGVEV